MNRRAPTRGRRDLHVRVALPGDLPVELPDVLVLDRGRRRESRDGHAPRRVVGRAERERGVGLALLPIFFPGELWPEEQEYWDARKREKLEEDARKRTRARLTEKQLADEKAAREAVLEHEKNTAAVQVAVADDEKTRPSDVTAISV